MVANFHSRGTKVKRLLAYCLNPDKGAEIISETTSHKTVKALAKELSVPCGTRPDSNGLRWVEHISLSVPQGEVMDKNKFARIAEDFMRELGFSDNHLWLAVIHRDTPTHLHIHIIANRIALDGTLYGGQREAKKAMRICDGLEAKYNLIRTDRTGKGKNLKADELCMMLRTGKLSTKQQIKVVVTAILKQNPQMSLKEFDEKLSQYGIVADLNISGSGFVSGISFTKDDLTVKGSKIGCSWPVISRHLAAEHGRPVELDQTLSRGGRTR